MDITERRALTNAVSLIAAAVLHAGRGSDLESRARHVVRDAESFKAFMEGRRAPGR